MANLVPVNLDKDTGKLVAKGTPGGVGPPGSVVGYLHIQTTATTTWIVPHNAETTNVIVQIYDTSSNLIIPDRVHIIDINTLEIEFGSAMDGRAHILLFPNPIN